MEYGLPPSGAASRVADRGVNDDTKGDTMKTTTTGDDRVLSVREAVAYMDEHYNGVSRRHHRSLSQTYRDLYDGIYPMTRPASGHIGVRVGDLRDMWEWDRRRAHKGS